MIRFEKNTAKRLDQRLVDEGHYPSRARALDAIKRGAVRVGGQIVAKASMSTDPAAPITIEDDAQHYVSRAALKLKSALGQFNLDVAGTRALDIGASTGGFTQVLLESGAAHVHAIDVGHDQLHESLRHDARVTCIEGLNARDLTLADLGATAPDFIVSDVSFISLKIALGPALELAAPGAVGVFLIKPQFEVGKGNVGKGGIVAPAAAEACRDDLAAWLAGQPNWTCLGTAPSPITGGDGNLEFLMSGRKADG